MKEEKKSNSLLYNIYKKYKMRQDTSDQSADDIMTEAVAEASVQTEKEEETIVRPTPANKLYLQPLYELYLYLARANTVEIEAPDLVTFEELCLGPVAGLPDYDKRYKSIELFERELCKKAAQFLHDKAKESEADQESAEEDAADETGPVPVDASCYVFITEDKMAAYLFSTPACYGGRPLDRELINNGLTEASVAFGLCEQPLEEIVKKGADMKIYKVAEGLWPVNGEDGNVIPKRDFSSEIAIRQDERGVSDFKNLHTIHTVVKDEVLCDIVPPKKGIDGMDVTGAELRAEDGKPAPDPGGKNTYLSADGLCLMAGVDGQVTVKNGRYFLEPVLVIRSNVDYGVGNVDFPGNVSIQGDVCSGFTVKAGGDVTVHGMVESANIIAGGDVTIRKGMNGNYNGTIDAQGNVRSSFLENCTVYAGGNLYTDSIVTSKVFCGDSVYVLEKQGVIIGGVINAFKSVEARIIGSKSRRETVINLGEMPKINEKRTAAEKELKEVRSTIDKLDKNIRYLSGVAGTLPPDKLEIYNQLKEQRALYQNKKTELMGVLSELENAQNDFGRCRVTANLIFPPARVTIGSEVRLIETVLAKSNVYLTSDGIQIGMV